MGDRFLDKVYDARSVDETRELYDAWAGSYDAEVRESGYITPRRCAEALAAHVPDPTAPVLDFGCGTGLSGQALAEAGFTTIDGLDPAAEMLEQARAKDVYRELRQIDPGEDPVESAGDYRAIAAIGVIGAGAAPVSVFDQIMHALPRQGQLVMSLNDHALQDRQYEGRISEWTDCGAARLLFREYGDHLPGEGLKANVYVIEKA
jgi:predicted TPR repeat methyltransferase